MKGTVRAWGPVAAWVGVILAATAVPLPSAARAPDLPLDKAVHAFLYGGLGWLVARALRRTGRGDRRTLAAAFVACVLFAAADELLQAAVPTRAPTAGDWAADVVGLAAGLLAAAVRAGRRPSTGNGSGEEAYRSQDGATGRARPAPPPGAGASPPAPDDRTPRDGKGEPEG